MLGTSKVNSLIEISTFARVVEASSFVTAARQLSLSPPVVTSRVQSLEARLGTRLLNRTTRSLSLTDAGKAYYDSCVRILADLEEAESIVRLTHSSPSGSIILNTCPLVEHEITKLICDFSRVASGFTFQVTSSHHMIDLVREGHDLAIRAGQLQNSTLVTRRLGSARLVLCAAPIYLESNAAPTQIDELQHHKCLAVSGCSTEGQWVFTRDKITHRVSPRHIFRANNVGALRLAALSGLGIALLPESVVADQLDSIQLVRVLPEYDPGAPEVRAVFPPKSHIAARVRRFVDFVVTRLGR